MRTTALALCYSTAEYCAPVWGRSCHAKTVDPELNNACRKITGTLRPTPLPALYRLAGIAPPEIRREAKTKNHKAKQETDNRHPLYGHGAPRGRLKSRNSCMATESPTPEQPTSNLLVGTSGRNGTTTTVVPSKAREKDFQVEMTCPRKNG